MERAKFGEEEPEVVIGPKTGPAGESPCKSRSLEAESPTMEIKDEAAGDTSYASSIDAMYPDPSDSFPGGLFPGSSSFDWSSPDSSSEGRNNIGEVAGQETCEERASRPGNSRIPGKDHRRYYHNHWRLEYLMDFNARSHSMICMVCGSSLATLKLSTIKRHIRQKHPYSLNWTPCEKEVIIGSWDAHLCVDAQTLAGSEEHMAENMKATTGPKKKRRRLPPVTKGTWRPMLSPEFPLPSPPDKFQLEQYMNECLQQWFRLEFLMDYDYQGNKLNCMICTTALPSLCLTDIKDHILDNHPTSLQFNHTQKGVIIDAWINRKETPEVEMEEDLIQDVEVEDDMMPDVEVEDEDMTPDVELEEDLTPDVEEDDEEEEEEENLAKKDVKDDQVTQATTKPRSENRMLKAKRLGNVMEKGTESVQHFGESNIKDCGAQLIEEDNVESTDLEILEEEEPGTGDVQLLHKEVQLLAEEEWKARKRHLLESGRKARELCLLEEHQKVRHEEKHGAREGQITEEEKRKIRERQLLEEEEKTRQMLAEEKAREAALLETEQLKAREAQLLKEAKKKTKGVQLLEEEKRKSKEAELPNEKKRKAKEVQLPEGAKKVAMEAQVKVEDIITDKEALLLGEEKSETREAQHLKEERYKRLEQEKLTDQDGKLKEGQALSKEAQNVKPDIIVKVEDHQSAVFTNSEQQDAKTENLVQAEMKQIQKIVVEGEKTQPSEPEKRVIEVQQMQQAPPVLGIGLPVLKMENPTPIIITRVSVLPENTILQPSKPKPSTSAIDISKTWRIIAPKVSPADNENPNPPSASPDTSQTPTGADPTVWEVSVSRGNNGNVSQNLGYQMRWRSEFLMDFNGVRGSVVCMYCSSSLTVFKESSIKRHIVQKHPHTANFSEEEKAAVLLDWENKLTEIKRMAAKPNKDGVVIGDLGLNVVKAPDCDPVEPEEEEINWADVLPENKGSSWEFAFGRLQDKVKDPRRYQHDRWKLEFLMDYTPAKDGLICMVCGTTLMNPKISTVKMHIQQKHPDTTYLSDQEKAVVMEEWEQKIALGKKAGQQHGEDEICIEINEDSTASETNGSSVAASSPSPTIILPTFSKTPKSTPSLPPPCNSAKRNYQVRWRTEFMMDYDCRRQGLICMVCGGTLATLKVSTIKRHIVQVHPYSVDFTTEERQRILEAYSEMALHYIHSEECFKTQPQEEVKGRKRKSTMEES
ncbi:uncharacterized protein LOC130276941 isoform X2 [Hyla sarda]|uniref:uncharacterized protein LOC130276941 isoform X2 n=1 Tax=Hyla sarda TaxID=327740 RepID=UPI0024C23C17|nr:uncharacterized protein LOC130276941 isoform X2 [Hyla sarda]